MMSTQSLPTFEKQRYIAASMKSIGLHTGILVIAVIAAALNTVKPLPVPKLDYLEVELFDRPKPKLPEPREVKKKEAKAPPKPKPRQEPKKPKPKAAVKPKPKPKPAPKLNSKPKPKVKPEPKPKEKPKPILPAFDPEYLEKALEAEVLEREIADAEEKAALAEVQKYKWLIKERIEQFFTLPPSAKKGMFVILEIELFPDGQVREVMLTQSSGDPILDRFAIRAVQSAGVFDVPEDVKLFQKYFRTIQFKFDPYQ